MMRMRGSRIGTGYYDVPNHKVNQELNKKCAANDQCIHRIIHVHTDHVLDVYIDFGFKDLNS